MNINKRECTEQEGTFEDILQLKGLMEHIFFRDFMSSYDCCNGLKHSHIITLIILSFDGLSPMSKISEKINLEKGSFTPIANKLLTLGFISKKRDKKDRRIFNIELTVKGLIYAKDFKKGHREFISGLINIFNDDEKNEYYKAIETVLKMTKKLANFRCNVKNNSKNRSM